MKYCNKINAEEIRNNISCNLKLARKIKSLSQANVAEVLGVSYQQIQKYESGKNRISAIDLFIISNFLGVPIEKFYTSNFAEIYSVSQQNNEDEANDLLKEFKSIKNKALRKEILNYCSVIEDNK